VILTELPTDPLLQALEEHLLWLTFRKICVLIALVYLFSRARFFSRLLLYRMTLRDRISAILFFALLAMVEEIGFTPRGGFSPVSPSLIAACAAGLLGGPFMGGCVGVVCGFIMMWHNGVTLANLSIAPTLGGLLGGIVCWQSKSLKEKVAAGAVATSFAAFVELGLFLLQERSSITPMAFLMMALPIAALDALGVSALIWMVADLQQRRESVARAEINRALRVVDESLSTLQRGLDHETAAQVAEILLNLSDVEAVALTDKERLLAHKGMCADRHRPGELIVCPAAREAVRTGSLQTSACPPDLPCATQGCTLARVVAAPLVTDGELLGTVVLFRTRQNSISADTVDFAVGFARFLSKYLLQQAELKAQTRAVMSAEVKALQAQMNPHFLFNALNTIAALTALDPKEAQRVAVTLGQILRSTLRARSDVLIEIERELENVRNYLSLEKVRFEDHFQVVEEIDPAALKTLIPPFTLQPIVENAVLHGLSPKVEGGTLRIVIRRRGGWTWCWVVDDGAGMNDATLKRLLGLRSNELHGLVVVAERLKHLYNGNALFRVWSEEGKGTAVVIGLPSNGRQTRVEG
jgi:two-component system sensor histidine kinase LytS